MPATDPPMSPRTVRVIKAYGFGVSGLNRARPLVNERLQGDYVVAGAVEGAAPARRSFISPPLGRPIAVAPFDAANLAVERLLPDALLELSVSVHEFVTHMLLPDERELVPELPPEPLQPLQLPVTPQRSEPPVEPRVDWARVLVVQPRPRGVPERVQLHLRQVRPEPSRHLFQPCRVRVRTVPPVSLLPRHRDHELEERVFVRMPVATPHQPDAPPLPEQHQNGVEKDQWVPRLPLLPVQLQRRPGPE